MFKPSGSITKTSNGFRVDIKQPLPNGKDSDPFDHLYEEWSFDTYEEAESKLRAYFLGE
jgi:hypothetical protein